jgi:hypothetical protein
MSFKVTRHATAQPPQDALERLGERIPVRTEEVVFSKVGGQITARLDGDEEIAMTRDERIDRGRRVVLEAVAEVCERTPELRVDWFAVTPAL